jgi:hypothetical protein
VLQTFLTEGLTKDNVCSLFEAAPNLLEEEQFALKYIEDNATDVIPSNSFLNLSPDSVMVSRNEFSQVFAECVSISRLCSRSASCRAIC